jgi:LPS-assembly protein
MVLSRVLKSALFLCTVSALAFAPTFVYAQENLVKDAPVDFEADKLIHNEDKQLITAKGNVEFRSADRILRADIVQYNLVTDTIVAMGNVVLNEPSGDVHFADKVKLKDNLKQGVVEGLQTYLAGGGTFKSDNATRESETVMVFEDASYTPCDCDTDEDGDPAWQIKAKKVTYDEDENKISYEDAKLEVFGVPVFYSPVLSHPDNKVKQKSGLLTPGFGFDSDLGAQYTQEYYWAIAPNRDLTVGATLTSQEAPVGLLEYRHRFQDALFEISGSATHSDHVDDINGQQVRTDDEFRGHIFADGRWDINTNWRAGVQVELTTDDQYLSQYNITGKDVLESEVYAERFTERNYAVGRILGFQDLRILEDDIDQPNLIPEIDMSFYGQPNQTLGGRWSLDLSLLGLTRDEGQDLHRFITEAGWEKRFVTGFGLVTTLDVFTRGDVYYVTDRDVATAGSGRGSEGTSTRLIPGVHAVSSFPMEKKFEHLQAVVEPVIGITATTNIDNSDSDIPNEDSQDVQIDASNVFNRTRFPGDDLIEDRSRVTYGLRSGLYGYDGSYLRTFLGQSYRFHDDDNPFPTGSGLTEQESDYVGQIAGRYEDKLGFDYRFQIGSDSFTSERHEFDGYADISRYHLDLQYLYARAVEGTDIEDSREQIRGGLEIDLTNKWSLHGDVLYDLGEDDEGLREASYGINYNGCCVTFGTTVRRNVTSDSSGESSTEILIRFGLKGLGEFGTDSSGSWSAANR